MAKNIPTIKTDLEQALTNPKTPVNADKDALKAEVSYASHLLAEIRKQNQQAIESTMKAKQTLAETAAINGPVAKLTSNPAQLEDVKKNFNRVLDQLREVAANLKNADKLVDQAQQSLDNKTPRLKR